PNLLREAKRMGFTARAVARLCRTTEEAVRSLRRDLDIRPVYKRVDTCAAEFDAATPYYYATYEREDEGIKGRKPTVLVLGSGPIRIGQGIEFDRSEERRVGKERKHGGASENKKRQDDSGSQLSLS